MVCCTATISKLVIVVLNIVFAVLGLAILIPGLLMLTSIDFLSDNIKPLLEQISFNGINLASISNNLPIVFVILGLVIMAIATLGLVGACCKLKTFLCLYAIIVMILCLAQVIILAFFFVLRSQLDSTIKSEFLNQLQSGYTQDDLDKSNKVSSAYNYMFLTMECCGVNAVTSATNDFDNTPWLIGGASKELPKGCCIGAKEATYSSYTNAPCTDTATSGTYHAAGCYDKIMDSFGATLDAMGYICLIAVLVQVLAVVFALCLCCSYMTEIV